MWCTLDRALLPRRASRSYPQPRLRHRGAQHQAPVWRILRLVSCLRISAPRPCSWPCQRDPKQHLTQRSVPGQFTWTGELLHELQAKSRCLAARRRAPESCCCRHWVDTLRMDHAEQPEWPRAVAGKSPCQLRCNAEQHTPSPLKQLAVLCRCVPEIMKHKCQIRNSNRITEHAQGVPLSVLQWR